MEFDIKLVGERLRELREIDRLTMNDAADKIGINVLTLRKYERAENSRLDIGMLMKMADYYGVSMDYILGRVNFNGEYYEMNVRELYEKSYEKYLSHSPSLREDLATGTRSNVLPQWPYNLFEEIYKEDYDKLVMPFTDEQKEFITEQIETLSERERECVYLYFKDLKTLNEIAKVYSVTKERIRQILAKSIRKLRSRAKLGELKRWAYPDLYKEEIEKSEVKKELEQQILSLDNWIEKYNRFLQLIEDENSDICKEDFLESAAMPESVLVDDLDLSVRSYNCMKRAFYSTKTPPTVANILSLFRTCEIVNVRNLGKKSIKEIADKLIEKGFGKLEPALYNYI